MNAIEQYRAGMKALGHSEKEIEEKLASAATILLLQRQTTLFKELEEKTQIMASWEFLGIMKLMLLLMLLM